MVLNYQSFFRFMGLPPFSGHDTGRTGNFCSFDNCAARLSTSAQSDTVKIIENAAKACESEFDDRFKAAVSMENASR